MLDDGIEVDGQHHRFSHYESNVLYALRFMIDSEVVGGNWVELPKGRYSLADEGAGGSGTVRKLSYCQIEAHMHYKDLISHPAEGEQGWLGCACAV